MKAALTMYALLIMLAGVALAEKEISNTREEAVGLIPAYAATWEPSDIPVSPLVGWVLTAVGTAMVLIEVGGMK
jgi:hypothetical protein